MSYVESGWHWQYGWLRRPEMDDMHGHCYEEPDGDLLFFAQRCTRKAAFLDVMLDDNTGEKYLCLSRRVPIRQKVKR